MLILAAGGSSPYLSSVPPHPVLRNIWTLDSPSGKLSHRTSLCGIGWYTGKVATGRGHAHNLRPGVRRGEGGGSWSSTELGSTSCLSSKSLVWKVPWTWFWEAYGWLPSADADPAGDELSPELVSLWLHLEQGLADMILKFKKGTVDLHLTHQVEAWPFYSEWFTRIFCDGITEGH